MYQEITLVGNLGSDPEMKTTSNGTPVTSFSLAVNKTWTSADGQKMNKTTWFRVTAWRKLAEICSQYLAKGGQVLVVGELEEARVYEKDSVHRASLEVTANEVKFLGSRTSGSDTQVTAMPSRRPMRRDALSEEDIPF